MTFLPFPALLLSSYCSVHEYGQATISVGGLEIDFTADFVPLIPLGSGASVQWTVGDRTVARFDGEVYLSSSRLLRLVNIPDDTLSKGRILLVTNTELPVTFTVGQKDLGAKNALRHGAQLFYLSMEQIKIRCTADVSPGDTLFLCAEVEFMTLRNLCLRVREKVSYRGRESILLCTIQSGGNDNYIALSTYAAKLEHQQAREDSFE